MSGSTGYSDKQDEQEERLERFEFVKRREFKILLLGPRWPEGAKKKYRDDVKQALNSQGYQASMIEDYTTKMPLDDKFVLIAERKNLIAAILIDEGGREGVSWELGFLDGFAKGFDKAAGGNKAMKGLVESVVVFAERSAVSNNLISRMILDGMLTKVEVQFFENAEDLIESVRRTCERKLYQGYRLDLWP